MTRRKKIAASALVVAAFTALGAVTIPADAAPQRASYSCGTCVAPITCLQEDSCVLDYRNGAWYARQWNGSVWVRLTMINGQ